MKKYKIFLLLIVGVAIAFAGCSTNNYLTTASTNLSLSTFYQECHISNFQKFEDVAGDSTILTNEADKINCKNYLSTYYSVLAQERCLLSAVDFLTAINQAEGQMRVDKDTKTKIYEYDKVFEEELLANPNTSTLASSANDKKVVIVANSAKNNSEITTYLFYKDKTDNTDIADLIADVENANLKYIFTQNRYVSQTKTYTLVYGLNGSKTGCSATVCFNDAKGFLDYELNTFFGNPKESVNYKKTIYKYHNSDVGIRAISTYRENNVNVSIVYEQLSEVFYQRLKLGVVKNEAEMLSMEAMTENKLAKANNSDLRGFEFVLDNKTDDNASITPFKYGMA